jgi:hypothetical protein
VVGDFPLEQGLPAFLDALADAALKDPAHPDAPLVAGECATRATAATPLPAPPAPATDGVDRVTGPVDAPVMVLAWSLPGAWRASDALASIAVRLYEAELPYYVRDLPSVARRPAADDLTARSIVTRVSDLLTTAVEGDLTSLYASLEDLGDASGGRALAAAVHLHQTASPTWIRDQLAAQDAISPEGLSGFFRAHLTNARMVAFVVDPAPPALAVATTVAPVSSGRSAPPRADAATLAALAGCRRSRRRRGSRTGRSGAPPAASRSISPASRGTSPRRSGRSARPSTTRPSSAP